MELREQCIFILSTAKFDGPFESTSYTIARSLARYNDVYYIDYPYTWRDYLKREPFDAWLRRKSYFSPFSDGILKTDIPRLKVVICPPLLSINFLPEGAVYRKALMINESILAGRIKKLLKRSKIKDYLYINSFNFHYPGIASKLSPLLAVYHCVDPLVVPYDRKHGVISEEILSKNSDLIICTSKQLQFEKKQFNPNTFFVPNAADISLSAKALDHNLPVAEKIKAIPKPVVGYFGNIERRMDFELLKEVIETNPDKSFVFAGPVGTGFVPDWFYSTSNIYLPGRFEYQQMPSVIKGFDVSVIPFKKDEFSRTIFPLKLFEYLGAGKPVVATDFNDDLREFTEDTVTYCSDAVSFSAAIEKCLADNPLSSINKRVNVAKRNTWEHRIQQFASLLRASLDRRM